MKRAILTFPGGSTFTISRVWRVELEASVIVVLFLADNGFLERRQFQKIDVLAVEIGV